VPQIYLGFLPEFSEPPKRLVGFQKVLLNPGEQKLVSLSIDAGATNHPLSYWDTAAQNWDLIASEVSKGFPGTFTLRSVIDLRSGRNG
jgi:beta-glucosidase